MQSSPRISKTQYGWSRTSISTSSNTEGPKVSAFLLCDSKYWNKDAVSIDWGEEEQKTTTDTVH